MGFLDDAKETLEGAKDKVADLVGDHEEKIKDGIDKAADLIEGKIGHGETVDKVADKAKDIISDLAGDSPADPA